jgi:uncharacterized protein
MKTEIVSIKNSDSLNLILGQSHFIKTVEDLHEILVSSVPNIQFGLAFSEASGPRLIRSSGTDEKLMKLAAENLLNIGAGHTFLILLGNAFPINVLPAIHQCPEVVHIFCATANAVEVVVARTKQGGGILGVIDGASPVGIEKGDEVSVRKEFLRKIGYKISC